MPRRDLRDLARVLLEKADGDELALEALLPQAQVPDGILGFHAQQAVEKRLKAVLAARESPTPPPTTSATWPGGSRRMIGSSCR